MIKFKKSLNLKISNDAQPKDSELNKLTMYYKVLTILSLNFWPRMNTDFTQILKKVKHRDTKDAKKNN